jgi:hypothetical protein
MRDHPDYDRFLFSLSKNEMVRDKDGDIYRLQGIEFVGKMIFRKHNLAFTKSSEPGVFRKMPSTLDVQKIRIDPIGQIFPAND